MHHLKDDNGTVITDIVEIANTLGAAIEKSSSSNNYSKEFQSQSLGTVQCGHAPFILFILLPIYRAKLSNSKRILLVPKCYV